MHSLCNATPRAELARGRPGPIGGHGFPCEMLYDVMVVSMSEEAWQSRCIIFCFQDGLVEDGSDEAESRVQFCTETRSMWLG